jgi:hypothetical protein
MSCTKRIAICSALLFLVIVCQAAAQTNPVLITTPGNGVSIRARLFYGDGRPCVSCPVTWSTVSQTHPLGSLPSHRDDRFSRSV